MQRLKIIDSHFHIWDPDVEHMSWLAGIPALKGRRFSFDDLIAQYEKFDVDFLGGVYVEVDCTNHEAEDRYIYEHDNPKILARMLRTRLSAYMRIPVNATGIREPLHIDSQPRLRCLESSFIAGLQVLAAKSMPFELCCREGELGDMVRAFRQVPELTLIIDHLGNVRTLDDESRAALKAMASLPHAYIKVSGDFPVDTDVVRFVRDVFAPDKLLFASNWPVVCEHSTFERHLELMHDLFGDDEDFFMGNAMAAYGIAPSALGADSDERI